MGAIYFGAMCSLHISPRKGPPHYYNLVHINLKYWMKTYFL